MLPLVFAVTGALFSGVGALFQKKGLSRLPLRAVEQEHRAVQPLLLLRYLLLNRYWFLGGVCSILGWLSYFNALSLSEFLDVRPITNLSLVIAVIGGCLWFHERLHQTEGLSVILILAGAILLSTQIAGTKPTIINLEPLLIIFGMLLLIAAASLLAGLKTCRQCVAETLLPLSAGTCYGIAEIFTNLLAIQAATQPGNSGLVGHLVIFASSLAFLGIVLGNIGGFFIKQTALYKGRASVVIPISTAISLFLSILLAILVFGEALFTPSLPGVMQLLRPLGIGLVAAGTVLLGLTRGPTGCAPPPLDSPR